MGRRVSVPGLESDPRGFRLTSFKAGIRNDYVAEQLSKAGFRTSDLCQRGFGNTRLSCLHGVYQNDSHFGWRNLVPIANTENANPQD